MRRNDSPELLLNATKTRGIKIFRGGQHASEWWSVCVGIGGQYASEYTIYIDASEVTNNIANTGIDYDNKPITIGSQLENNVMSYFFNGKLDDIRIYNRALTQEEITYLANN